MTPFKQFYNKPISERRQILKDNYGLEDADFEGLQLDVANNMIENTIGTYNVPFGIAPNFIINTKEYAIPMATEEPSVIAAASNGAKLIGLSGGFQARVLNRAMIGQIAFPNPQDIPAMQNYIDEHFDTLNSLAQDAHPSIYKRGGGLQSVSYRYIQKDNHTPFFIVYFTIDTLEAMGANIVNTILEALKDHLESVFDTPSIMSIISNYANQCLVEATCSLRIKDLKMSEKQAQNIHIASDLASVDVYRATTHNKGIMNGISAFVLASGNDTRAIEAAAHAYASDSGTYQPLATWTYDQGILHGTIIVPLALGSVGGSIAIHPTAQLTQKILKTKSVQDHMMIAASLGLAQNFAAVRALTNEGIQKGHMSLHAKSLLLSVGVSEKDMPQALSLLLKEKNMNTDAATKVLASLKQK